MLRRYLAALLLVCSVCAGADDAPRAALHYSEIVGYLHRLDQLKDLDRLTASAHLGSTRPGVKPSDITMSAKLASGGVVELPIAADGSITLPTDPALAREDPLFVSNQPKGSLSFNVTFNVTAPARKTDSYAGLMAGAVQFNEAIDRQGIMASMFGPSANGLLFLYNDRGHSLTLHGTGGDQVFKGETLEAARKHLKSMTLTDDSGKGEYIYVPLEKKLLAENPATAFDALPIGVMPAL